MKIIHWLIPPIPRSEAAKVLVLQLLGHTAHCACRIAFGDGECETGCGCPRRLTPSLWRAP